jgi:hypothetical protein
MSVKAKHRLEPFVNGSPTHKGKPSTNGKPPKQSGSPEREPTNPTAKPDPSQLPLPPSTPHTANDRDDSGRFQKGCKGGPGNPFARKVATLRKSLLESVTEDDVAQLGRKLLAQALGSDVAAAKVLLSYIVGKPTEVVDPDRIEIEAWKLVLSWPTIAEALAAMVAAPPDVVVNMIRDYAPKNDDELMKRATEPILRSGHRVMRRREEKGK